MINDHLYFDKFKLIRKEILLGVPDPIRQELEVEHSLPFSLFLPSLPFLPPPPPALPSAGSPLSLSPPRIAGFKESNEANEFYSIKEMDSAQNLRKLEV